MKQVLFYVFILCSCHVYGQDVSDTVFENYAKAKAESRKTGKPIFVYLGKDPNHFANHILTNDTLTTFLTKEFVNLLYPVPKDKRQLKKRFDAKKSNFIILQPDQSLYTKSSTTKLSQILDIVSPLCEDTEELYSENYKKNFVQTDSSKIYIAIQEAFSQSSAENTRQLTIAYLKDQNTLLSPINYQLMKTLMPIGDEELLNQFLAEMKPEMYTREMAEKISYELLLVNDFSVDEAKQAVADFDIPFTEEVDLYLTLYDSTSFKEKKESCFEFVLQATTYDFNSLKNCFTYLLRNGNKKQINELELKYMFSMNDGDFNRALLYADLLGQLYLSQGDMNTFLILQKRNEHIREKFLGQNTSQLRK